MRYGWAATMAAAGAVAAALTIGAAGPGAAQGVAPVPSNGPGQITVSGEGRVEVVPDMATIRLGVTSEGATAAEAIRANSGAMALVLDRLWAAGIEERDVQTADFRVEPRWEQRERDMAPEVTGFVARNVVMVRVRDLGQLGDVLDQTAGDGANTFDGLSFGLADPSQAEAAARRAAVADARARAELYADAAGVGLGPLLALSESQAPGGPAMMEMAQARMAMDQSVPIQGGEVATVMTVTMTYAVVED